MLKQLPHIRSHRQRSLHLLVASSVCLVAVLASSSVAQGEKAEPNLKVKFHQDFRQGEPKNPNLRRIRDDNFKWEVGGARVTFPGGENVPTTGISAAFGIKGDFEITASYEVLKADKPTEPESYGVGVNLFVAIDGQAMDAVALARRVQKSGKVQFASDVMKPNAKPPHFVKTAPSTAAAGKLRIQRRGSKVRFLVAEGDRPEFTPINQAKAKEPPQYDVEFGNAEIRYFQVGGETGNSTSALDLRLLDLTVRAEELPGLVGGAEPDAIPGFIANPGGRPVTDSWSSGWRLAVLIAGPTLALVGLGLGTWYVLRRRHAAAAAKLAAAKAQEAAAVKPPTASFPCAECGKKIKVKLELAGKKVKCAQCGKAVVVPRDLVEEKAKGASPHIKQGPAAK